MVGDTYKRKTVYLSVKIFKKFFKVKRFIQLKGSKLLFFDWLVYIIGLPGL